MKRTYTVMTALLLMTLGTRATRAQLFVLRSMPLF
jgi:hypothetical protein